MTATKAAGEIVTEEATGEAAKTDYFVVSETDLSSSSVTEADHTSRVAVFLYATTR